jgi:O-antigen/teichoic acid export membrane protein
MLVTSAICIAGIGGIAWRIPAREHLRDSLQVGGSTLTLTVAGALVQNSELVLLRSYAQPDEVGLYAAAASIGNTLYVLCAPLYIPAFPRTVTAYAEGKPTWPILRDVLVLIVGVGLLAEFGAILLGGAAAQLVFGPSFNRVGTYLPIYIAKTIALLLLGTVGQYAIALARSQITYVAAGIAFLGPLLVLVFRPEVLVAAVDMFAAAATASAAILGLLALRRGGTRA